VTVSRIVITTALVAAITVATGCGALDPDRYVFDTDLPGNDSGLFPDAGGEGDAGRDVVSLDVGGSDADVADTWFEDARDEDVAPPPPADLARVHADVFVPICAACHIDAAQGGLSLIDDGALAERLFRESVQAPGIARVVPGDLDASYLWLKVEGRHIEVGGAGESMPIGGSMTPEQRAILEEWITAGSLAP
jgi:hypothetical protein